MSEAERLEKRTSGEFFTLGNPFRFTAFTEWADEIDLSGRTVLEPFAGANNIIRNLQELDFAHDFASYDIQPQDEAVFARDTLERFPQGFDTCITNPPWLAAGTATKLKLPFPKIEFDNLWKQSLHLSLQHCDYVAILVPSPLMLWDRFVNRCSSMTLIHDADMYADTVTPSCLALFKPEAEIDGAPKVFYDNAYVGRLDELRSHMPDLSFRHRADMKDNDGVLGYVAHDNTYTSSAGFHRADNLPGYSGKNTGAITRIGIDYECDIDALVEALNARVAYIRKITRDVPFRPYQGLRKDGMYRRHLGLNFARNLICEYLDERL